jgi:hypothetical protein
MQFHTPADCLPNVHNNSRHDVNVIAQLYVSVGEPVLFNCYGNNIKESGGVCDRCGRRRRDEASVVLITGTVQRVGSFGQRTGALEVTGMLAMCSMKTTDCQNHLLAT